MMRFVLFPCFALLAACGPMSPEKAAVICEERAQRAAGLTTEALVGISSDGAIGQVSVGISSDFIRGRDPQIVYQNCVYEKTGQGPIRPLVL